MRFALALILSLAAATAAHPLERTTLGWGRLFTNDLIGDGKDRWRTGSYAVSVVRGVQWTGQPPADIGEMLEWRFRTEVIAPADLSRPATGDRRYVGAFSFGLHTQFTAGGLESSIGVDLVATGPQTGIGSFQKRVHRLVGMDRPRALSDQIGNAITPTLIAEAGHSFRFGDSVSVRPFAEVTAGVETMARVGGDVLIGRMGQNAIRLRDEVTGQRYTAGPLDAGLALSFGGDVARVYDSQFLPPGQGYSLTDDRVRLRAGVGWQGQKLGVFYGVTWLGREFQAQPDSQVVGSLSLHLRF